MPARALQSALVYVNTLMMRNILADNDWSAALTRENRCGLTPLFWPTSLRYGEIELDMSRRLTLTCPPTAWPARNGVDMASPDSDIIMIWRWMLVCVTANVAPG